MGSVTQTVKIENTFDVLKSLEGTLEKAEIRTMHLDFLVDSGAAMVCIPIQHIITLGLKKRGEKAVRTGNGDVTRSIYGPARVTIWDQSTEMEIMEIPEGVNAPPLLGYLVLEALDLVVAPKDQVLIGNPANNGKYILDMF